MLPQTFLLLGQVKMREFAVGIILLKVGMIMKSGKNKNKKTKAKKEYKPRVIVRGNTGTRVICSKKDKQNTRQALKLQLKNYY